MKRDMGNIDSIVRILVSITIVAFYLLNVITGPLAYVLLTLTGIFILTSFVGVCPLYTMFRINKRDTKNQSNLSAKGKK
jgi:hypothetical protein